MICNHLEGKGQWHNVPGEMNSYNLQSHRVCGGCRLVICWYHPDCEPEAA